MSEGRTTTAWLFDMLTQPASTMATAVTKAAFFIGDSEARRRLSIACPLGLTMRTKRERTQPEHQSWGVEVMKLLMREAAALVSVAGFVWMICSAASLVG
jgi:hypothetical protein